MTVLIWSKGGKFVLRIEDTDLERSTKESEEAVLGDLSWLALAWDEVPGVGGDYGPYRQSERNDLYKQYAEKLLQSDQVYRCFCSKESITIFQVSENIKNKVSAATEEVISGVSSSFQKAKDAKVFDLAKKGYGFVKDELSGSPSKRKRAKAASSQANVERSTRTDIVVVPVKQSKLNKKWEAFKAKMQGHLLFKRMNGFSEPVVTKSQEIV
ncbi:hypothetical protein L2E82_45579 [Cichorium intybus]|uniref:Uncharacterized protein n=1 Tax=Cichorium intybus TaxID=13427 RepID=A0ACB8ZUP8_CICIN|nr:hypothetical protein L2E82_45579 [Cichorium intybus]